jgi:uncharacterized protein (UPF0335 family)
MDIGSEGRSSHDPDKMFQQLFLERESSRKGESLMSEIDKIKKANVGLEEENKKILQEHQNVHEELRDNQFELKMVRKELEDLLKKHDLDSKKIAKLEKEL